MKIRGMEVHCRRTSKRSICRRNMNIWREEKRNGDGGLGKDGGNILQKEDEEEEEEDEE